MYTHSKQLIIAGTPIGQASKAIIMLHGRGASAESIISLQKHLHLENTAIFAPQATEHSWYPYRFIAPQKDNEPALGSALAIIDELVTTILTAGIAAESLCFMGFSQGACLSLEYVCRHAQKYGGVIAFTGGLIGDKLTNENYQGDFSGTPILVTTGDPDEHVPLSRVKESVDILRNLNANVRFEIFEGRPHTIMSQELALANEHVLKQSPND